MEHAARDISIKPETIKVINFALQQNGIPVVREVYIHNTGTESLENITLRITAIPELVLPYEKILQQIPAGQMVALKDNH